MRIALALFIVVIAACTPRSDETQLKPETAIQEPATQHVVRIIVGFSHPDTDPENETLTRSIATGLNCNITFLHPASGNAAVYLCDTQDPAEKLTVRLNALGGYADINYAELDQKRKINQ